MTDTADAPLQYPTPPAEETLAGIFVEHLLTRTSRVGLVMIRAKSETGLDLRGQVTPEGARQIAATLYTAAARAEYEQDFMSAAVAHGVDEPGCLSVLGLIREGENQRETAPTFVSITPKPSDG